VIVTGGAGAIGGRLAAALLAEGVQVVVVDDLSCGVEANVPAEAELVPGDILDPRTWAAALVPDVETVFHLAASFANQASVDDPEHDLRVNALGTLAVADAALGAPRAPRVVYASTSCVYGACTGAIGEDTPLAPLTPYATSKLAGEHYLRYFAHARDLPVVTLRLFNTYGPGDRPGPHRSVIPNFVELALRSEPLTITGSGAETRDFTYVDDVAEAFLRAGRTPRAVGRTYNIGTGVATRIHALARTIRTLCGSESGVRFGPSRDWDGITTRCASPVAARRELGFTARTDLEEGLASTIAWARTAFDHDASDDSRQRARPDRTVVRSGR
jgi:UDP-glucose 4-epimerase